MQKSECGTLYLRKPSSMLWQYSLPPGKIFLLDGKYAWFYTKGDAQVQRIPAKEVDVSLAVALSAGAYGAKKRSRA